MELPSKSLYTLPEAVEFIEKQAKISFTLDQLVSYAKDGKILFSILANEGNLTELIKEQWIQNANNSIDNQKFDDVESAVREILSKAERHASGQLIVYVPSDANYDESDFFRSYYCSDEGWAVPIENVIIDPAANNIRIPYYWPAVKPHDKQIRVMASFVFDRAAMEADYDHFFVGKEKLPIVTLEMVITREQLEILLVQSETPNRAIPQNIPIQEKRELILKGWASGAELSPSDLESMEFTHKQLWKRLSEIDATIFQPVSPDTRKEFFQKQSIVKGFQKGRRTGG